jgi:hypothetical protein
MGIRGIQFLSDAAGEKRGVLIDLRRHRRVWEDLYDAMVAESRKNEPRRDWEDVKRKLGARKRQRG